MDIQVIASGSKGNVYSVSDGKSKLLLECGVPISTLHKAIGYCLSTYSGCLITHEHGDHAKSAADVSRYMTVYATNGTLSSISSGMIRKSAVEINTAFCVGTFTVRAFKVEHDAAEPVGYYIYSNVTNEYLLFFTDTYYVRYKFPRIDYLMGECNYDERSIHRCTYAGENPQHIIRVTRSHMGLDTFLGFLRLNDLRYLRHIYVLHLSDGHSDAGYIKTEIQKTAGCEVTIC